MWIDSIEYLGFGAIVGEKVDFKGDKLNLVIESNEYGKSTMAESIWAILYGIDNPVEKESFKPWQTQAPYAGILDLNVNDLSLRIIRNFDDQTAQVLNRESGEDLTAEYVTADGGDQIGLKLTGMTKDLFRNTCLLGQRHLDEHHVGGNIELRNDLKSLADTSTPGTSTQSAADIINEALRNYPFNQGHAPVKDVIEDLEARKSSLYQKIDELDEATKNNPRLLQEINDIEKKLSGVSPDAAEAEYNNLKLEKFELEEKSQNFKSRKSQRDGIEKRLLELTTQAPLADQSLATLKEMWMRRESRIQDVKTFGQDVRPEQEEYERIEQELLKNYPNFDKFQIDEGNTISSLAISLYNLQKELEKDRKALEDSSGATPTFPTGQPASLSEEELEEARSYSSLMVAFNEQLADSQKRLQEAEFSRGDIEEKQKANRLGNIGKGVGLGVLTVVCFATPNILASANVEVPQIATGFLVGIALLSLLACFFFTGKSINFKSYMLEDLERAQNEEDKIKKVLDQSTSKVANLENTLTTYAQKAGLATKEELLNFLKTTSSHEEIQEEQQTKENLIKTKEQQTKKIENDLIYYFNKVGRDADVIDSQRAMDLAQDIKTYFDERTKLDEQFAEISNTRKQMDFLEQELKGVEEQIRPLIDAAGIESVADLDEVTEEIEALIHIIDEKDELNEELSKLGFDMSGYEAVVSSDAQLQAQIEKIDERLDQLVELNPDLANLPDPDPDNPPTPVLPWGENEEEDKEELRRQKENLLVELRTNVNNHDSGYLDLTEELAIVEHELICAKRAKLALELAAQKLEESSSKTYEDWSGKLNESAKTLLDEINSDFEMLVFDNELNITVKLKDNPELLDAAGIKNKLSTGVKEQVHWLARMALSRFLSRKVALPIILDEPFSEADDNRFLKTMKFLITEAVSKNQIIIFSCHKQRHHWLESQLSEEEKGQLHFIERQKISLYEEEPSSV